jgi:hypothetical protein
MTNTGKVLIVGLVLMDLGFVSYLLFPKGERSKAAADAVVAVSETKAVVYPRLDDTHVTAGSVVPIAPPMKLTAPAATVTGAIATAPPVKAADVIASAPPAKATGVIAAAPPQHTQPVQASGSAEVRESVAVKTSRARQIDHGRDELNRHGSNPVAAAITRELVRESAKPDPSLPLPASPPARDNQDHRGSNPVAAAMTQELVRQSAKVNPAPQPATQPGTQ